MDIINFEFILRFPKAARNQAPLQGLAIAGPARFRAGPADAKPCLFRVVYFVSLFRFFVYFVSFVCFV